MRNPIVLILTFTSLLAGCAKDERILEKHHRTVNVPPGSPKLSAESRAILLTPSRARAGQVSKAVAELLRTSSTDKLELARDCHMTLPASEDGDACLLAWADSVPDPEADNRDLNERLSSRAQRSRIAAIAITGHPQALKTVDHVDGVLNMLKQLKDEPAWIRARLISGWLTYGPRAHAWGEDGKNWYWEHLDFQADGADPESIAASFSLATRFSKDRELWMINKYCPIGAEEHAQIHCLRFLSALVHPLFSDRLPHQVLDIPAGMGREAWTLFERTFPERALRLKPYVN